MEAPAGGETVNAQQGKRVRNYQRELLKPQRFMYFSRVHAGEKPPRKRAQKQAQR